MKKILQKEFCEPSIKEAPNDEALITHAQDSDSSQVLAIFVHGLRG